jgi:hypothetical protein
VFGVYAPTGTPRDIVRAESEINRALATAALKDRIMAVGNARANVTRGVRAKGRR